MAARLGQFGQMGSCGPVCLGGTQAGGAAWGATVEAISLCTTCVQPASMSGGGPCAVQYLSALVSLSGVTCDFSVTICGADGTSSSNSSVAVGWVTCIPANFPVELGSVCLLLEESLYTVWSVLCPVPWMGSTLRANQLAPCCRCFCAALYCTLLHREYEQVLV
jgi:hypothetical protein